MVPFEGFGGQALLRIINDRPENCSARIHVITNLGLDGSKYGQARVGHNSITSVLCVE